MLYSVQNLGCQRSHYLEHCLAPGQQEGDSNMNHTMDLKVSPQKWYKCLDKASHMTISPIHSGQRSAVIPHAKENHKYLINSHMTTTRILGFGAFMTFSFVLFFLLTSKLSFIPVFLKSKAKVLGFGGNTEDLLAQIIIAICYLAALGEKKTS